MYARGEDTVLFINGALSSNNSDKQKSRYLQYFAYPEPDFAFPKTAPGATCLPPPPGTPLSWFDELNLDYVLSNLKNANEVCSALLT